MTIHPTDHPSAGRPLDRRRFLGGTAAAVAGGVAMAGPLQGLVARAAGASATAAGRRAGGPAARPFSADYGPLFPTRDQTTGLELLNLPTGFEYLTFGWTNDAMDDGTLTPGSHDGMGAFRIHGRITLVRNHERTSGHLFAPPPATYNPAAGGGTTTLSFDPDRAEFVGSYGSLAGTVRNCAGGITPWGSWMSGEETTATVAGKPHGYIFEAPARDVSDAVALTDMGRFSHEAASVDPLTGWVYETEDAGSSSGFYRFIPNTRGRLSDGGRLQMLQAIGANDLRGRVALGTSYDTNWVDIDHPDPTDPITGELIGASVFAQGFSKGGTRFARLEGCWADGRLQYFVSTSGGGAGQGQIWVHDPARDTLTLVFESPSAAVLNAPDNIAVTPRGGLILCEDGSRQPQSIHGLTPAGEIFRFAENNVVLHGERNGFHGDFRGSESAGACFDPGGGGNWLFFNIQSPGITFAITGPWRNGAL